MPNDREPFVNVFHLGIPKLARVRILGIVLEKFRVMFKMRSAAAGIGDDGVELFRRELVDGFRAKARASSHSPLWACSEPQQC